MQTRNAYVVSVDLVRSTRHTMHLETTTGNSRPRQRLGVRTGRIQDDRGGRAIQTVHGNTGVRSSRDGAGVGREQGRCHGGGSRAYTGKRAIFGIQ
jgi:hypothetical protein